MLIRLEARSAGYALVDISPVTCRYQLGNLCNYIGHEDLRESEPC